MQTLQPFFDSSLPFLKHPDVKEWGQALSAERERMKGAREGEIGSV